MSSTVSLLAASPASAGGVLSYGLWSGAEVTGFDAGGEDGPGRRVEVEGGAVKEAGTGLTASAV
ncbi:hypothetical protein AAHZ94_13250 [Streptomyces sp. HSW2009]|uniref:hypothetical protein n=1 Tax=Streptomyces sp. HSW2009 TaxID=3142890 RepID=UPI0032ED7D15